MVEDLKGRTGGLLDVPFRNLPGGTVLIMSFFVFPFSE
jgi:hypothetical protein